MNNMWLRLVEVWLTQRLLQSQAFHRYVRRVHRGVQELRHGKLPDGYGIREDDMGHLGGTKIDRPGPFHSVKRFFKLFADEVKEQLGTNKRRGGWR